MNPSPSPSSPRFDLPGCILHGGGARRQLPVLLRELGIRRPLLVTDPGVVRLGAAEEICQLLRSAGFDLALFADVQPDPTDANVAAGFAAAEAHRADGIVALGGGSPIDCAKVVSILGANRLPLNEFMGWHKIATAGLPLVAIPTTAGTGSEATKVAVITDTTRDVKMMMLSAPLLPRAAIVDYELTLTMPRPLTAAVGVDTLTHGIEAYVSRRANGMTDPLALSCIGLCARFLRRAWRDPADHEARSAMMLAACQGGMAFSNSSVALVHGMSRPIGAVFHLPHGLSNAVLLPVVTRYSVDSAPARYATVARTVGCAGTTDTDESAARALVPWLEDLNRSLELPRFGACPGVTRDRFDQHAARMAADALASGSPANNPRVPSAAEIVRMYQEAW